MAVPDMIPGEGGEQRATKRERALLAALVVFTVVLRIGLAQADRVIKWDESDYLMLGRNLWAGQGFTTAGYPEVHYTPLVPLVLGAFQQVADDPEVASELAYILFGALLILPYHALARRLYGERVALLASALLAVFPVLAASVLYWGTMSEPLYLVLVYAGLLAAWRATGGRADVGGAGWHALAGLMFALAYLARPEAILYFGLFALWLLAARAARGELRQRRAWAGLLAYVGAFALLALPYIVYLHQHTGQWTFSGKVGVTFDLGAAVIEQDAAAYDIATASLDASGHHIIWFSEERFRGAGMLEAVLADPGGLARRAWANLRLWFGSFFHWRVFPIWALALLPLAWCIEPWDRQRAWRELFLCAALLPPFGFIILHIETRFFAPAFPILLLWVAKGLSHLGVWLRESIANWREGRALAWDEVLRWLPAGLVALYFLLVIPLAVRDGQRSTDTSSREVGRWLAANVPVEARVMSRDVAVAVYARRAWVPSPHAEYAAYLAYARHHQVDYLVITQREGSVLRPALAFLLDGDSPPPELALAHVVEGQQGRTLVYRIR